MVRGRKKNASEAKQGAVDAAPAFEAVMTRLDEIVAHLEEGELSLEDAISLFEEGMSLTRQGMAKLDEADRKVSLLLQEDGADREVPFELDGGGES